MSKKQKASERSAESVTTTRNMWDVYDFVQPLGSGTFGVVREVKPKQGKQRFAVKTIPVAADIEMVLMLKLEHEHIVRLEHAILEAPEMHLIMELCSGGDLQAWIDDRWDDEFNGTKFYDSPGSGQVSTLSRQMLSAVAYMHHLSVAHRDIKPSNWLIAARGFFPVFKLSDFGLAVEFQPGERMTKTCGSFMYMAPEVFNKSYTELCDVWSSGMVIYELVCGKPFFTNIPEGEMEAAVCKAGTCEVKLEEREWNHQRPWLKTWLQQMLVKESGRPAASMALNHPEIQRAKWTGKCQCNVS